MGKSTINGHFQLATLNYQRVSTCFIILPEFFSTLDRYCTYWLAKKNLASEKDKVNEHSGLKKLPFMVAIYGWFAVYLIKMVIFHSYVSLPEDNCQLFASLRQSVSKVGNDWTQVSINLCNIHVTPMQKSGHDYFFHYVYQFLFNVSSCFPNMLPNFSSFLPICSHFLRKFHRLSQLSPTFPQFPPTFPQLFRSFSPRFCHGCTSHPHPCEVVNRPKPPPSPARGPPSPARPVADTTVTIWLWWEISGDNNGILMAGWWFQTFFNSIWDVILPIDFNIFQDG